MQPQPVVFLIETESRDSMHDNPDRDALVTFLSQDCGCKVLAYDHELAFFDEYASFFGKMVEDGSTILLTIAQDEVIDKTVITEICNRVRADFPRLPIVILTSGWNDDEKFKNGSLLNVEVLDRYDPDFSKQIGELIADYQDRSRSFETAQQMHLLQQAYYKSYLAEEDDRVLGVADSNGQVVAEYLRIRLLPAVLIAAEFDATIDRTPRAFLSVDDSVYRREMKLIRSMSRDERWEFCRQIQWQLGSQYGGFGDNASGFAIDPVTLEYFISSGFAEHGAARRRLTARLLRVRALRNLVDPSRYWEEEFDGIEKSTLPWGLIVEGVEGFVTPILRMWDGVRGVLMEDEDRRRVAATIIGQRRFIPVDMEGQLLED